MAKSRVVQTMSPQGKTVLLLGNYRATIAVARALAESGYRVIAGLEGEPLGAHCSRYVDEFWDHPKLQEDKAAFFAALKELLATRNDIEAVLPVSEEFVQVLSAREHTFTAGAVLASPDRKVVAAFSNKVGALELADAHCIPTLPFARVTDHSSLFRQAQVIGFPLAIRALGTTARLLGRKALIADSMEELDLVLPQWPEGHAELLLQRFAQGDRHNIYFAAEQGNLIGYVQTRILRTNAPDGTGLAVDGRTELPDLRLVTDTQKLVSAANYTGIGLAQFIVNAESGNRCFLELNPRVSGSHSVAEKAGLPLSRLAVELARGNSPSAAGPDRCPVIGKTGLRYAWTDGDLLAAKQALIRGDASAAEGAYWLLRAIRTALSTDVQMVWSWRDPGPVIMSLLLLLPFCRRIRGMCRNWFTTGRSISIGSPPDSHSPVTARHTPTQIPGNVAA